MENTGRYRQSFWMKLKSRTYYMIDSCMLSYYIKPQMAYC